MTKGIVDNMLKENDKRNKQMHLPFNPVTGLGSVGKRKLVHIDDYPIPDQYLPVEMLDVPLVKQILKCGSISEYVRMLDDEAGLPFTQQDVSKCIEQFDRLRWEYDFPYWAFLHAPIHPKDGGDDIPFKLNLPQRRLVEDFESMRKAGQPIREIVLKARQWGGSTCTQIYMAWLQLVHKVGLNSNIVGHVKDSSAEVEAMYRKIIEDYPIEFMYPMNATIPQSVQKWKGDPNTNNIHHVEPRKCKVKVGTAERPDSARGGDSALVHCTEVAFWKKTDGKTPEKIVRSAVSGAQLKPYTMIVYESTANGTGNFFQRTYDDAKAGRTVFKAIFVAWWQIEMYSQEIKDVEERYAFHDRRSFALWLYENRHNKNVVSRTEESGEYLYSLWQMGATLEAIYWYILKRTEFTDHADIAAEYPSTDEEAFQNSGARVFSPVNVNKFKVACRPPAQIGDLYGNAHKGKDALKNLSFAEDKQGELWVWEAPETFEDERCLNRYLVVVDVGGRGQKADFSVICVFDRYWMLENDKPCVVAQWYGHIDMDLLAWKAAQIAKWYDDALLVIESNTLETKDKDRIVEGGDQSEFILNQIKKVYDNLYARKQSEADIKEGAPRKYGFHTNVSTKPMIISTLVECVREQLYVERDERVLDEFLCYERKPNKGYGAIDGKHDDLLMTRAIGLHICFYEMDRPKMITVKTRNITKQKLKKGAVSAATI